MKRVFVLMVLICAVAIACGEKKEAAEDKKEVPGETEKASGDEKEAPQETKGSAMDLPKLGLKIDVPTGSAVSDSPLGEGHMVQGPGITVFIAVADDSNPKTIEKAKEDAESFTPKNIKSEELADGWVFSFENEGGMGTNYWVNARRTIGDKEIWCNGSPRNPEEQTNVINACKSLKK